MKTFVSAVMAGAMVMSMAATALAAQQPNWTRTSAESVETDYQDKNGKHIPGVYDAYGPFAYDVNDDKALTVDAIEYGDTAYYVLADKDGKGITDSDSVDGLKIKSKWEEGDKLVKGVSVTKKKVSNPIGGTLITEANKYYYMIALTTEPSTSTSDADIIGTLTLNKTKSPKVKDLDLDISLNINWANSYLDSGKEFVVQGDLDGIEAEKYYSLKFDSDEEIELGFEDDSTFTVDVSGQGKTLIYFDTKFNSNVAARYPLADLNFWNGNGAKFNRTGEFFLSAEDDATLFLYEILDDGSLAEVSGAVYDDSDEGFYFKTRTLGSYVVSDMELETGVAGGSDDIVVTPVNPTNPSTGAVA
ncbi:MAG: hypothetical protein DBX44_00425 [Oscillospiraceae bacterium]|nr:MAG: hypothetical protein DBX44_00425 [Oscillospiraceae bacterium]